MFYFYLLLSFLHIVTSIQFEEKLCNKDMDTFVREKREDIQTIIAGYSYKVYGEFYLDDEWP